MEVHIFFQALRCPGVYFSKDKEKKNLLTTIIPKKGNWVTTKLNLCLKKKDKSLIDYFYVNIYVWIFKLKKII